MANCTKCSAELIGSAKFCAACGAPVAHAAASLEQTPSTVSGLSPASPANPASIVARGPYDPAAHVNPFAATASPSSKVAEDAIAQVDAQKKESTPPVASQARPPPADGQPPISPLAVSNALSQRGAFQHAVENAKDKTSLSQAPAVKTNANKPGTQLMRNAPSRPEQPAQSEPTPAPEPAARKPPPRTVAMNFNMAKNMMQQPAYAQPPAGPGGRAWNAPPAPIAQSPVQAAAFPQYGFGYAPGARVHVTWSNGQRYPATVSQVSGSQCLVVFPDGQQHWVETQYLAPG